MSENADFIVLRMPDRFAFGWMRCGNAINRALHAWLGSRWPRVVDLLDAGERFVELR